MEDRIPLDTLIAMGFRTPIAEIPSLETISATPTLDMAVNILASAIRGGNAETMAELLRLATEAIAKNGYGITYVVGPDGKFGLMVVPRNPETNKPDMEASMGDYAIWTECGDASAVRDTIDTMIPRQHARETNDAPQV